MDGPNKSGQVGGGIKCQQPLINALKFLLELTLRTIPIANEAASIHPTRLCEPKRSAGRGNLVF